MMEAVELSIIIPVYNVAIWLPQTVDNVLAQTFRDFELILVDDGATDGSAEICDSYAQRDSRVRVIHQKNAGVSAARNVGVAHAKGQYIGFIDSDDIVEMDMYQVLMGWAERYDADVVQCEHDRNDRLNNAPRSDEARVMDGPTFVRRIFTKKGGRYTNQVSLCTKVFKKQLFEGIVFPVGQVYEDEQETYKLCLKAKRIAETPDILYHYIKRENSIITGISSQKMLDKQKALLDRLNYLPQRLPELDKNCCRSFLDFSAYILCELYKMEDWGALRAALESLLAEKKRLKPWLSIYEKMYVPVLRWKWTRNIILKNDFEPIQRIVRKFR